MRTGPLPLLHLSAPLDGDCRKRPARDARFVLPYNVHHRAAVGSLLPTATRALGPGQGARRATAGTPGGFLSWLVGAPRIGGGAPGDGTRRAARSARGTSVATCAALAFAASLVVAVVGGLAAVLAAPPPRARFGAADAIRVGDDATCLRASRHADYVVVDVAFGSPRVMLALLLRLDVVTEDHAVRLFSTRVVESLSVACGSDPIACVDVFVAQLGGPASPNAAVPVAFNYTNFINEEYAPHPYAWKLQLDGELRLKRGYEYVVTPTHVCWSKTVRAQYPTGRRLHAVVGADAAPTATVAEVVRFAPLAGTPVHTAVRTHGCTADASDVRIFPGAASYETDWLAIGSSRIYEAAEGGVPSRRTVVEIGRVCADAHASYVRAQSLYLLDCAAWDKPCAELPSVPWRRLATATVAVFLPDASEDYIVTASDDATLHELPGLDADSDPLGISVLKLLLMTLAAAVVWIRSAKQTSSNAHLLRFAVREALEREVGSQSDARHPHRKTEDFFVGALAVVARGGVSIYRLNELAADGFARLAVAQLVGAGLSIVHMLIRYAVLRDNTSALLRLGGSTALVDAPVAVLVGFATAPLLTSAGGQFDPTARMLTALLITLVSLPRCAFAATCCAVRAVGALQPAKRKSRGFVAVATVSAACWLGQACTVGLLLADGFATPAGYSLQRSLAGSWTPLSVAAFAGVVAAAQPQLVRGLSDVASMKF